MGDVTSGLVLVESVPVSLSVLGGGENWSVLAVSVGDDVLLDCIT